MPGFYEKADAMLITLAADPVLSLTLPGKVQSYMAVGKPVIASINGETASVINEAKCGYCGDAEDVEKLVGNILEFITATEDERKVWAQNARKYYELNFEKSKFIDALENELEG